MNFANFWKSQNTISKMLKLVGNDMQNCTIHKNFIHEN